MTAQLLEGWYVYQTQIDGLGGKAHRYKNLRVSPDHAKRLCGGQFLIIALTSVVPSDYGWQRCRRCEAIQHRLDVTLRKG